MRPHILARSWYTLALVALFLLAHLGDYLTVGRLIYRFDPLLFEHANRQPAPLFLVEAEPVTREVIAPAAFASVASESSAFAEAAYAAWQRLFAYEQPPSLALPPVMAKLYTFAPAEAEAEQAVVGGPMVIPVRYRVVPVDDISA